MIGSTTRRLRSAVSLAALTCLASAAALADLAPANYAQRPEVRAFIDEMASERGFDAKALRRLFAQVQYQPKVIEAISRPVIAPPKWYEFAPRFLAPERVEAGVAFWRAHEAALARADKEFGVPPEIIDRLFDPFVSSKRDGVGLGLVNTRSVVESHGGRIAIVPNSPKGTIVRIEIPIRPPASLNADRING